MKPISHFTAPINYKTIPRLNENSYSTAHLSEHITVPEYVSGSTEEHLQESTFRQHDTYGAPVIQSDNPIFRPTETDNKLSSPQKEQPEKLPTTAPIIENDKPIFRPTETDNKLSSPQEKQPEKLPTFLELPYNIVPAIKAPEINTPQIGLELPKTPLFINIPEKQENKILIQTIKPAELPKDLQIPVNTQVSFQDNKLQYTHGFSLEDGTKITEQGKLISTDDGWEYVIAKSGKYEYISPDGTPVKVNWIADENGYRVL